MSKRITFLGLPVDALTMQETLNVIDEAIRDKKVIHHVVVNAAKVVNSKKDPALKEAIVNCDIINADGQSIVWASKLFGNALPERVTGIDLMTNLVELASVKKYKIFLLGANEEVVSKTVAGYSEKYGSEIICGYRNGYYTKDQEAEIAKEIASSKPDMLFVAITSPKKEVFLNQYKHLINVPFIMGVGGAFDVIAGKTKRAPVWMQKAGFEWLYRVLQEPRRMWKRYLVGNSTFILMVFKEKVRQLFQPTSA